MTTQSRAQRRAQQHKTSRKGDRNALFLAQQARRRDEALAARVVTETARGVREAITELTPGDDIERAYIKGAEAACAQLEHTPDSGLLRLHRTEQFQQMMRDGGFTSEPASWHRPHLKDTREQLAEIHGAYDVSVLAGMIYVSLHEGEDIDPYEKALALQRFIPVMALQRVRSPEPLRYVVWRVLPNREGMYEAMRFVVPTIHALAAEHGLKVGPRIETELVMGFRHIFMPDPAQEAWFIANGLEIAERVEQRKIDAEVRAARAQRDAMLAEVGEPDRGLLSLLLAVREPTSEPRLPMHLRGLLARGVKRGFVARVAGQRETYELTDLGRTACQVWQKVV